MDSPRSEEMNIFVWGGGKGDKDQPGIDGADGKNFQALPKPVQCKPLRGLGENDESEEEEQESLLSSDVSISAGYCHGAMTVDGRAYIAGCGVNGANYLMRDEREGERDYSTIRSKFFDRIELLELDYFQRSNQSYICVYFGMSRTRGLELYEAMEENRPSADYASCFCICGV